MPVRKKPERLPVIFHALDLEGTTKRLATVLCPRRADLMTVDTCATCDEFQRIVLHEDGTPMVCCRPAVPQRRARYVSELIRMPALCTSADTPVAMLLPYLPLKPPYDAIPVLADDASPIGITTCASLRSLVASGVASDTPLELVMSSNFVRVRRDTAVADAAALLPNSGWTGVVVVAPDGAFMGVIAESDLRAASGDIEA